MRRSLRFVSLTVLLFLGIQVQTSCSPRISGEGSTVPPVIELTQGEESQKYNIQLDFMKHHMSGMLIVRRMPDNEIRIVASTYFGLSLFDFSLHDDQFNVNSCIEPMKRRPCESHQRQCYPKKNQWKRLWKISGLHYRRHSG